MVSPGEASALWISLAVAAGATALALPPGIGVAWLLARKNFPGKALLEAVVLLPLVLPPVVVGYLLLVTLGRRSLLGGWLEDLGVRIVFTGLGMAVAAAVVGFPLLVRTVRLAMEGVDPALEAAARTLGHGRAATFWRVTLPLARGGILTGALLAFARALGEFGATIMVAPNLPGTRTLALEIFHQASMPGGEAAVARLAALSIGLSLVALLVVERGNRPGRHRRRPPERGAS